MEIYFPDELVYHCSRRTALELSDREGDVLSKLVQYSVRRMSLSLPLPIARHVAFTRSMSPKRRTAASRIPGAHPAGLELARPHLDVKPQLRVDLVVDARAPEARAQRAAELRHVPDGRRTLVTAAEKRAHSWVSAVS